MKSYKDYMFKSSEDFQFSNTMPQITHLMYGRPAVSVCVTLSRPLSTKICFHAAWKIARSSEFDDQFTVGCPAPSTPS